MKVRYLIIASLFLMGLSAPVFAQEKINDFASTILIQTDGSIVIAETIFYDFGNVQRHGIFRDIPLKYKTSYGNYTLRISDIAVTDATGTGLPLEKTSQGNGIRIRIGDPNVLVSGLHEYHIQYRIERAVTFGKTYDELYWNVTGNGWEIPIYTASATVSLPIEVSAEKLTARCFAGYFGSDRACAVPYRQDTSNTAVKTVLFRHTALQPKEGLTFVLQFPKGVVKTPTQTQIIGRYLSDNWSAGLPLFVFSIMFYVWYTRGRDPKGRGLVIAEYEAPDGLLPAQVGAIHAGEPHDSDVTATIIHLAIKGYIKIRQEDEKKFLSTIIRYTLLQVKKSDEALLPYERRLLDGLFGSAQATEGTDPGVIKQVALNDLKEKFYKTLGDVKNDIFSSIKEKGYSAAKPSTVRLGYAFTGILLASIIPLVAQFFTPVYPLSLIVSGVIIILFSIIMPKPTYKGAVTRERILGLQEYLQVAEADRIKFHNAPEKKPEVFEKLLPYAMVLGVETEWAAQFSDIYTQEPAWYQGTYAGHFNTVLLVNNLNTLSSQTNSVLSSSPSSGAGGGGFSGGGFGGGGGGSW